MTTPTETRTELPIFAAIAEGLAASTAPIVPDPDELGDTEVRRLSLLSTPVYDAFLMTWPAGGAVDEHAHETIVAMSIVAGEFDETLADPTGTVVVRRLRIGSTVQLPAGRRHRLVNVGSGIGTTVHVHERIPA